jgi:hypothetical protein
MIMMFFFESAFEAQRAGTRAAANKSKNKTIGPLSVWSIYFIIMRVAEVAVLHTLFTSVLNNLLDMREILKRVRAPA